MLTADVEGVESMIDDHSWVEHALCAEQEPDALFVQGAAQRQVRMRCMECPVRLECLADALERRMILRAYPNIGDWSKWLNYSPDPLAVELRKPRVPQSLSMKSIRASAKVLRDRPIPLPAGA